MSTPLTYPTRHILRGRQIGITALPLDPPPHPKRPTPMPNLYTDFRPGPSLLGRGMLPTLLHCDAYCCTVWRASEHHRIVYFTVR